MTGLKLDQFVEEAICDKYVQLSLGDLPKVSCGWRHKPRLIHDNIRYMYSAIYTARDFYNIILFAVYI